MRHERDFADCDLDLDFIGLRRDEKPRARIWIDTDRKVRPQFSEMLMALRDGDVVVVLALSDLGRGFEMAEAQRMISANGATLEVFDSNAPPPEPRQRGPKPQWPTIPQEDVEGISERWHNPDIYKANAALLLAHKLGHDWMRRHHLNDNLGPRSKPKLADAPLAENEEQGE